MEHSFIFTDDSGEKTCAVLMWDLFFVTEHTWIKLSLCYFTCIHLYYTCISSMNYLPFYMHYIFFRVFLKLYMIFRTQLALYTHYEEAYYIHMCSNLCVLVTLFSEKLNPNCMQLGRKSVYS